MLIEWGILSISLVGHSLPLILLLCCSRNRNPLHFVLHVIIVIAYICLLSNYIYTQKYITNKKTTITQQFVCTFTKTDFYISFVPFNV